MVSRMMIPFGGRGLMNRGDPFLDLHREVNRLFDDTFRGMGSGSRSQGAMMGIPRIDVGEAGDNLKIAAELPGVAEDDVDLRLGIRIFAKQEYIGVATRGKRASREARPQGRSGRREAGVMRAEVTSGWRG